MSERDPKDHELTEADLLGYSVDDVKCDQCRVSPCGLRIGSVMAGKPLVMCTNKEAAREVLTAWESRRQAK